MKLLTFIEDGIQKPGILTEQGVLHVQRAAEHLGVEVPVDMMAIIGGGQAALDQLAILLNQAAETDATFLMDCWMSESALSHGPCVPAPGKIICVGLNYRKHAEETGAAIPTMPILFGKFGNAIAASGDDIVLPMASDMVDYEAELGLVIGEHVRNVSSEEALSKVFGYFCGNDVSARDLQKQTSQWLLGKTCDGFAPVGPWLVTADEVPAPNSLSIRSTVNEQVRQNSNTRDMIFPCDFLISYISRHLPLEPGDIILTGTPEGVIFGMPESERVYLADGDLVTVEVEGLGVLRNRMVKDPEAANMDLPNSAR